MADQMVRVSDEVKAELEAIQTKVLNKKTQSEAIKELIRYRNELSNHLLLDNDVRDEFKKLADSLKLRKQNDLVKLLLHHFASSPNLTKETLNVYVNLNKGY